MKTAATLVIVFLTVSCIALMMNANVAKANPYEAYQYQTPPTVTINSPTNNSRLSSNECLINFTITKPEFGWLIHAGTARGDYQNIMSFFNIILDGKGIRFVEANSNLSEPFNYCERITNLTDGTHNLEVEIHCQGWDIEIHGFWSRELPFDVSFGNVSFTSDINPPRISILKPTINEVIDGSTAQDSGALLVFEVSESVSSIFYSLDGKDPITASGNVTLFGLSAGLHSVKVYANDTFGNMGESEAATFTVESPRESFSWLPNAAAGVGIAAVVAVAAVVYQRKRRDVVKNP